MAALLHDDGANFDRDAFFAFVDEKLPAYARPAFVRVRAEMELTGTFKYLKSDLKKQGYDPHLVRDPLFVRNDQLRTYEPMSAERFDEICDGKMRF
jgi:acyl-CoA synthetase (AMP-forming)/AMP-acid ligase II